MNRGLIKEGKTTIWSPLCETCVSQNPEADLHGVMEHQTHNYQQENVRSLGSWDCNRLGISVAWIGQDGVIVLNGVHDMNAEEAASLADWLFKAAGYERSDVPSQQHVNKFVVRRLVTGKGVLYLQYTEGGGIAWTPLSDLAHEFTARKDVRLIVSILNDSFETDQTKHDFKSTEWLHTRSNVQEKENTNVTE